MRGETVSHYQVLEELGGGGMGVVYKALDTRLRRHVALKFLPVELTRHNPAKERFLLEARAASTLDHPNVCTVHEVDETPDGRLFIAMAYYQGQSLRQRIEQGRLGVPEALKIALQVARGLEAAHRAGIVHRDVKPANIMLPPGGDVKVLDFGLAKLEGEARRLTRTGTAMGTVAYMSPEQASGGAVDARSDLWSLGVVLYEMLTGRLPFKGDRDHSLIYSILHEPAANLRTHLASAPRAVERLIERLLEKDPRHRHQSASELVSDLEALARGESVAPTQLALSGTLGRVLRRRRRTMRWAAVAVGGIALLAAAAWLSLRPRGGGAAATASRPELRNLAVLPFANLTGDPANDYLCDGVSAVLTQQLSEIPGLNVVGRSETLAYRGTQKGGREIARELGVGALLEGQLVRLGDKLRLQTNLVEAASGVILWKKGLEGTLDQLLEAQGQVGPELSARLALPLTDEQRSQLARRPTRDTVAYDHYLRAIRFLEQVDNPQRYDLASELLREALTRDPGFVLARAKLSGAIAERYPVERNAELLQEAESEANRALEIDPASSEARIALAHVFTMTGRHEAAVSQLLRVAALHPDSDEALTELAAAYAASGDASRAETSWRKAIAIRPAYWGHWNGYGLFLWHQGNAKGATEAFEKAASLAPPEVTLPLQNLGALAIQRGDFAAAIAAFEPVPKPVNEPGLATNFGTAYYYLGRLEEAGDYYRLAIRLQPTEDLFHTNLGDLLLRSGDPQGARAAYREAARLLTEELKVNPTNERVAFLRGVQLAKAGDCRELAKLRTLAEKRPATEMTAHLLAQANAACGDRGGAIAALRLAVERGYPVEMLAQDADFLHLARDPDFAALAQGTVR